MMGEKRIFGLGRVRMSLIVGTAAPLVPLALMFDTLRHEIPVLVSMYVSLQVLLLCNFSWIVAERNSLKSYHILSAVTRKPTTLYIDEIKKMHIIKMSGSRGHVAIHFLLANDTKTVVHPTFLSGDIRAFEEYMMKKGIEVQNPEK